MIEKNKIDKMSLSELKIEEKKAKKEVNIWSVILGLSSGIALYGFVNKGEWIFFFIPILFMSLNYYKLTNLKKVRNEIKRKEKTI